MMLKIWSEWSRIWAKSGTLGLFTCMVTESGYRFCYHETAYLNHSQSCGWSQAQWHILASLEVETGGLQVQCLLGIQSEIQSSLCNWVRPLSQNKTYKRVGEGSVIGICLAKGKETTVGLSPSLCRHLPQGRSTFQRLLCFPTSPWDFVLTLWAAGCSLCVCHLCWIIGSLRGGALSFRFQKVG